MTDTAQVENSQLTRKDNSDQLFAALVNSGNANAIAQAYESKAVFVTETGRLATGHEEIIAAWSEMLQATPRFSLKQRSLTQSGDIVLYTGDWSLEGENAEGGPVTVSGQVAAVLRRQPDGRFLLVIDNAIPF